MEPRRNLAGIGQRRRLLDRGQRHALKHLVDGLRFACASQYHFSKPLLVESQGRSPVGAERRRSADRRWLLKCHSAKNSSRSGENPSQISLIVALWPVSALVVTGLPTEPLAADRRSPRASLKPQSATIRASSRSGDLRSRPRRGQETLAEHWRPAPNAENCKLLTLAHARSMKGWRT